MRVAPLAWMRLTWRRQPRHAEHRCLGGDGGELRSAFADRLVTTVQVKFFFFLIWPSFTNQDNVCSIY